MRLGRASRREVELSHPLQSHKSEAPIAARRDPSNIFFFISDRGAVVPLLWVTNRGVFDRSDKLSMCGSLCGPASTKFYIKSADLQ